MRGARFKSVLAVSLAVLGAAAIAWSGNQVPVKRTHAEPSARRVSKPSTVTSDAMPSGVKAVAETQTEFYVSPSGRSTGDGSAAHPWDLATALNNPRSVHPGATIWIRGGTYTGAFTSVLAGSATAPITVRNSPGERVVIDLNVGASHACQFAVNGSYTWYWGLEFTDSNVVRSTLISGSDPADLPREAAAVYVQGHYLKFINCVIHDLGDGLCLWENAIDAEAYGCIIFNNGWNAPDRGHGHGLYTQNNSGTKSISDLVIFNNFGLGVQAYGVNGHVNGYDFDGLVSFNNGSPAALLRSAPTYRNYNLLVGSERQPSERISVTNSHLYFPVDNGATNLRLGYSASGCRDVSATGNTIVRGQRVAFVNNWQSVVFARNTVVASDPSKASVILDLSLAADSAPEQSRVDKNDYYDIASESADREGSFRLSSSSGSPLTFRSWRSSTGFDDTSSFHRGPPEGVDVAVRPNRYEPGRAIVVVYNWSRAARVRIDLSQSGLRRGRAFELRDVQDLQAPPVFAGTYNGHSISLEMTKRPAAIPTGMDLAPESTLPEFGVFLVEAVEVE